MDQKDKRNIRDDGRKPGTDTRDSRGQQGQRDRSRDSESAGQNRQMQSGQQQPGQHQPGQQQAGQRQTPGQQQAGHAQPNERRQESGQQGSGSVNKPHQGGMDRDKDRQR
ncbi:MAG: hypothetical protein ACHQHK_00480 [Dongiales bacterium]